MIAPRRPQTRDELEALIKEARARQLRRRLLGAAAVAITAAIALSGYALTLGGRPGPADRPARGVRAVPLCRASQLSASSYWNGAGGTRINFFTIANRGGSSCSLPSGRPVALLSRDGSLLHVQESRPDDRFGFAPRAKPLRTLAPGRKAAVYMQWANWCGRPRAGLTTTVALRFADGLLVAAHHVSGQPPCLSRAHPSLLVVSRVLTPS
jgi:hypothetical protein